MKAILVLEGRWKLSKQESHGSSASGGRFKKAAYTDEQNRMIQVLRPQLAAVGWTCTRSMVAIRITFYAPAAPVDFDNCGLIPDALKGPSQVIGRKRIQAPGLAVWDDRQFYPALVEWVRSETIRIVIDLEELEEGERPSWLR